MDPTTGYVRAMVGGRDFDESHFNRAVQAQASGRLRVQAVRVRRGARSGLFAGDGHRSPRTIRSPRRRASGSPEDEHSTADSMTLRTALRTSSNRAAVQLLQQVGIPKAVQYARTLGVGTCRACRRSRSGPARSRCMSMTAAYAAFANHGIVPQADADPPRRGSRRQGAVPGRSRSRTRAVSETTAFLMSSMLADVINAGHRVSRARRLGFTLPAAGKTGTTNDYIDAWFVGFTPQLVTGVWVGFDQPRRSLPNGFAGDLAVPIWASFMKAATKGDKPDWFDRPANVVGGERLPACPASCRTTGCDSVEVVEPRRRRRDAVDGLHRILRHGHAADDDLSARTRRASFIGRIAGLFGGGESTAGAAARDGEPALPPARPVPAAPHRRPRRAPTPADDGQPATAKTPKKRGFWSRVFGKDEARTTNGDAKQPRSQERRAGDRIRADPSCLPDITGHRASARTARARRRARHAAAEPDLCRARRRRQTHGGGRARADAQLPEPRLRAGERQRSTRAAMCAACTRIARGVHADVLLIEPGDTGAIKIDQVRDAIERAAYRPFEGRRRVVIVDDADALNAGGAERAAEDARGAAGGFDVRPGDVAAGHAAADGAFALSAAAVRAGCRRRTWRRC